MFQYGAFRGDHVFVKALAKFLSERYQDPVNRLVHACYTVHYGDSSLLMTIHNHHHLDHHHIQMPPVVHYCQASSLPLRTKLYQFYFSTLVMISFVQVVQPLVC